MPRQKSQHVDSPKAVGERLKAAREAAGLSQRQLAFSGCSPAYISRIEAGDRIPSLQLLRELGRRLDVSEDFLATGVDPIGRRGKLIEADLARRFDDVDTARALYDESTRGAGRPRRTLRRPRRSWPHRASYGPSAAGGRPRGGLAASGQRDVDRPALAENLGRAYAALGEFAWLSRSTSVSIAPRASATRGRHQVAA